MIESAASTRSVPQIVKCREVWGSGVHKVFVTCIRFYTCQTASIILLLVNEW